MGWWPGDSPIFSLTRVFLQANVSFCACQFGPRGFLVWWLFYMRICTYVEYLNFGFCDWSSRLQCVRCTRVIPMPRRAKSREPLSQYRRHMCILWASVQDFALFRKTRVWQRKKRWDLDDHNTSFLFLFGQRCLLPAACKGDAMCLDSSGTRTSSVDCRRSEMGVENNDH